MGDRRGSAPVMERVGDNLYRKGSTYYAAAVPPGKRRLKFKSLGQVTKMHARELLPGAIVEIRTGRSIAAAGLDSRSTSDELLTAFLEYKTRTVSERTASDSLKPAIENHLRPWFQQNCRLAAQITPEILMDWHTDQLESGAATWTIKARWSALTGALKFGVRRGVLRANPADVLEPGERPGAGEARHRYLNDAEIRALITAAHTDRWRLLILVMLFGGLRLSEALGLRWDDVDLDGGVIRVRQQLRRKPHATEGWLKDLKTGAGRRDVVLMQALAGELRKAKLQAAAESLSNASPESPVFATATGRHVTQRNATREFTRAVRYSKLVGVTPHALRHTFASILVHQTNGADVPFVADQLGHADPSITLRVYAKLFRAAKSKDEARRRLDAEYGNVVQLAGRR